jgi:hypothetical protein
MKTTTIISALSLALIITSVNAGFAKPTNKNGNGPNPTVNVKYQVTVNLDISIPLCNTYQIEILDANGRQVAPPQNFVAGTEVYIFEEQTRQTAGIRIARMVTVSWGEHYVCDQEWFTPPDVHLLHFKNGQSYFFNLYPSSKQPK